MGKQFDDLAKALARGESRRQALRKFVAGTVGVILGAAMPASAAADNECKPAGTKCNKDSQCCTGFCMALNSGHGICA
jgi:hypothetical protein